MLDQQVEGFAGNERWLATAEICGDARWPDETRRVATESIAACATESLPVLSNLSHSSNKLAKELSPILRSRPDVVEAAVSRAAKSSLEPEVQTALRLVELSQPIGCSLVKSCNSASRQASEPFRIALIDMFCRCLSGRMLNSSEIRELGTACSDGNTLDELFASRCCLPVLRGLLEGRISADSWKQIAAGSIEIALQIRKAPEHIRYLAQHHKPKLTRDLLEAWVNDARKGRGEQRANEMSDAIAAAGLQAVLYPPVAMTERYAPQPVERQIYQPCSRPIYDERPEGGGIWTLVMLFSVISGLLLMAMGVLGLLLPPDGGTRFPKQMIIGICFGGPVLLIGVKAIQRVWLRRAEYAFWVGALSVITLLVLVALTVVAGWWAVDGYGIFNWLLQAEGV